MKRILIGCGSVLTLGLALVLSGFGPDRDTGIRTDEGISEMVSRVDPAQILR